MAAHHLAIAKASFAASLIRPDVVKVARDEIPRFHSLFETAIAKPSAPNIQTCKQWLLDNIIPSPQRTSAFGKYLTSYSRHTQDLDGPKLSISRLRLHALYLLNDLLHHAKYHTTDSLIRSNLTLCLQPFLSDLFHLAAAEQKPRISSRLRDLIGIWEHEKYYRKDHLGQITETNKTPVGAKELPFIMPFTHGDPSLSFHDLPAGNLMPHIVPNEAIAMHAESIRALQFSAGPADENLVNAIKDFLKDVEGIDDAYSRLGDETNVADIDEMGQLSYRDKTGEAVGDTYYGWSRAFCKKMKSRGHSERKYRSSRGRSRSPSSSPSPSPHKRRRYSASTRSRSSRSFSRSRSRSHETKLSRNPADQLSILQNLSRSNSRSPPHQAPHFIFSNSAGSTSQAHQPVPNSGHPPLGMPQRKSPSQVFPPSILGSRGFPLPPPRPPNWNGPWPPPPPPPMAATGYHGQPLPPPPTFPGFGNRGPPPFPPGSHAPGHGR